MSSPNLLAESSWIFWMNGFWALENHVLLNMLLNMLPCYFSPAILLRYIKYNMVHSSKLLATFSMFVFSGHSFKTAIFSRFSKVAIATWYFINEDYNSRSLPEFSVSMLKKFITLVPNYVDSTRYQHNLNLHQIFKIRRSERFWRKKVSLDYLYTKI